MKKGFIKVAVMDSLLKDWQQFNVTSVSSICSSTAPIFFRQALGNVSGFHHPLTHGAKELNLVRCGTRDMFQYIILYMFLWLPLHERTLVGISVVIIY